MENDKTELDSYAGAIEILSKSDEWAKFTEWIKKQIEVRKKKLLTQIIISEQDKAEHNLLVGEISMANLIINIPRIIVEKVESNRQFDNAKAERPLGV